MDVSQINGIIDNLAQKLGTATDKLWAVLMKQAYVDGIANLVWTVISLVVLIVCVVYFLRIPAKMEKAKDGNYYDFSDYITDGIRLFPFILAIVATVVFLIVLPCVVMGAINCLANPEYSALQHILDCLSSN